MIRVSVKASKAWCRTLRNPSENLVICGPSKVPALPGANVWFSPGSKASPNGHPTWEELAEKQIPNQS